MPPEEDGTLMMKTWPRYGMEIIFLPIIVQ